MPLNVFEQRDRETEPNKLNQLHQQGVSDALSGKPYRLPAYVVAGTLADYAYSCGYRKGGQILRAKTNNKKGN